MPGRFSSPSIADYAWRELWSEIDERGYRVCEPTAEEVKIIEEAG